MEWYSWAIFIVVGLTIGVLPTILIGILHNKKKK